MPISAELREKNPYFILELEAPATRADVERQKNKLVALFDVSPARAARYLSPFGDATRSVDDVRRAAKTLEEARQRLWCGLWAKAWRDRAGVVRDESTTDGTAVDDDAEDLLSALGWW